jgi:predicted dehydrogenase
MGDDGIGDPVRWGVLGTAMIATTRTMPAMAHSPMSSLWAVASRRRDEAERVATEFGAPRAFGSYAELLADPDVEAVYVPLPNHLHVEWTIRAMEAGKHVLCEKPLCLSAADVALLRDVRDRTGRHVEEAFVFRNHPQWFEIDALLRDGAIGEVRGLQATLAKQFLDPDDIRNDPARGGGAMYDLGSYAISACSAAFGRPPLRAIAMMDRDPNFGIDRLSTAMLDYGGSHAVFTVATQSGPSSWATHQQLSILGSKGWLRCDFPFAHARPTGCRVEIGDLTSVGCLPTSTITYEPVDQYALQVERFSRFLRGGVVPTWPIEDAAVTLQTIEAMFESARTERWQPVGG